MARIPDVHSDAKKSTKRWKFKKIKVQFDKKIVKITLYPEPGDSIAWKQENKTILSLLFSSLKGFRLWKLVQ